MALLEETRYHLEELEGSDHEIVSDEPNIIGWDVKNEEGTLIGKVDNLLFDRDSRKIRYIVLDLDGNKLNLDEDRKVIIPISVAELYVKGESKNQRIHRDDRDYYYPEEDGNVVLLPEVSVEQLDALPLYEKDHLSTHVEAAVRSVFGMPEPDRADRRRVAYDDDFYRRDRDPEGRPHRRRRNDD